MADSSQQNALVELLFGTVFEACFELASCLATARVVLKSSGLHQKVLSLACLDAIDKVNFLPLKRANGDFFSPNSAVPGQPTSPGHFPPFGQNRFVLGTTLNKSKLQDRVLKARYLRSSAAKQDLLWFPENGTKRLIRSEEFFLPAQYNRMKN